VAERHPGIFLQQLQLELGTISHHAHVGQLIEAIAGQICYYNTKRIYSAHRVSPAAFRQAWDTTTKTAAIMAAA